MTEKGKKPGADASGESDPLSATGMFLNAFAPQPEPPVEQAQEGASWGSAKPAPPGEFTKMFHKLETPPAPPLPQARSSHSPPQEAGEFTRIFVAAATSPGLRPAPKTPDAAPFAPPAPPRMRGFSTPGTSDSASAEGSFTQLFRTPSSPPAPSPLQSFTPLPSAPPQATEPAWPQSLDPVPNGDRMASGGLTQLFRSLSDEGEPPPNRIGESPLVSHAPSPASVTGLIRRLTEDQQQSAAPTPPTPLAAAPADLSGPPGEFTRIMTGGGNLATPVPPTLVFPAAPVPAFAAPPVPAPPAPAFAVPQVPALAIPPAQPPKVAPSAPPQKSKLQQMLPMLLVLNAFLVVVLILLLVFALKSK